MPNIDNLIKLRDWLLDGAPHAVINMHEGMYVTGNIGLLKENYSDQFKDDQKNQDCGTVCCIAGAAHLMSHAKGDEIFPSIPRQEEIYEDEGYWDETRDKALMFLGLKREATEVTEDQENRGIGPSWYGHSLFASNYAPDNCTPQQAAQAVQNVIDGKEPWVGVT